MALQITMMQTTDTWHFLREYLLLRLKQEHEKGTRPFCAKHGVGLPTTYIFVRICCVFRRSCNQKSVQPWKTKYLRISWLAVIFWALQRQTAEASLDVKAGLIERAVVAFCNTLINICQMEKGEWIKHMPFLYLQVPDDESILSGTTEHGEQLHHTTRLEWEGRRTKKRRKLPGKNRQRKSSSATKWTGCKYLLKCLQHGISLQWLN